MSEQWFYGGLLTYLTLTITILAVLAIFKWYRPHLKWNRYFNLSLLLFIIAGMAVMQILSTHAGSDRTIKELDTISYYKSAEWLKQEDSVFNVLAAKAAWEDRPATDNKFLLAMAYLYNGQVEKAEVLLEETALQISSAKYVKAEDVEQILQEIRKAKPESNVQTESALPASPTAYHTVQFEPIGFSTLASSGPAAVNLERLNGGYAQEQQLNGGYAQEQQLNGGNVQEQRLNSVFAQELILTEAETEAGAAETEQETGEASELESELELEPTDYTGLVKKFMDDYQERVEKEIDLSQEELNAAVKLDIDLMQYSAGTEGWNSIHSDAEYRSLYELVLVQIEEGIIDEPIIWRDIAEVSLFVGEYRQAETLLLKLLETAPEDEKTIALLSELYLSGRLTLSEEAQELPQFQRAFKRTVREQAELEEKMRENVQDDLSEDSSFMTQEENVFDYDKTLANEFAYVITEPLAGPNSDPVIDVRLSRYYFNKGESEKSLEYINQMKQKSDQLSPYEQQVISRVSEEKTTEVMTSDVQADRDQVHYWRQEAFNVWHSPKLNDSPTIEDESYAYHLSEKLRNPSTQRIMITSITADEDSGQVELYVQADNMEHLTANKLLLSDNEHHIEDFSIVKLSESVSDQRAISLVIDVSGSMSGDPIDAARNAASGFVLNMEDYEKAELIAFNDSPSLVVPLSGNKQGLASAIRALDAGGGTNISSALRYAIDRFLTVRGQRVLFIFTDGEDAEFSRAETRASLTERANRSGLPVYAIGFGAGYRTLSEVAEGTGGMFIAAPNISSILNGFDEVAKTLERTYKVTYTLEEMENGRHTVELGLKGTDLFALKNYYVGDMSEYSEGTELVSDDDRFVVEYASPSAIQRANTGTTRVTLTGSGMRQVESVRVGKKKISNFSVQSDTEISFHLNNNMNIGDYEIVLTAKDGRKANATIQFMEPGMMDSVKFGWATVYGRSIKQEGNTFNITGDPSVDYFIYPKDSGDKMVLTDGKQLTFNGIRVGYKETRIPISPGKPAMTMRLSDNYGEKFTISHGAGGLNFSRIGIEFQLANLTYQAKMDDRAGTLTAKSGIAGWQKVIDSGKAFNTAPLRNSRFDLSKYIKLPTRIYDLSLTATFQPDDIGISGKSQFPQIKMNGMFEIRNPSLAVEYNFGPNRFMITGGVSNVWINGNQLTLRGVDGADLTLGFENSLLPKAFGLTLYVQTSGGIPLGQTGLTINKFGALLDFTSARAGKLDSGFGTVADMVRPFIQKLNSFKIFGFQPFDIDPTKVSLLNLDASLGVKNFATHDWEASGQTIISVLGFNVDQRSFRLNRNLIEFGMKMDVLVATQDGTFTVIFSDPRINNHLTMNFVGNLDAPFVDLNAKWVVVPARISSSVIAYAGKAFGFEVDFALGELEVFY